MKQIVKQRFHGTENDRDLIEAEIQVDELEELPEPDEFEGKRQIMGSQCWVIGTGDLYGLTSTGDWVKVNFMGNGEGGGGFTPTEEQLTAMNSGIDSEKVAQIAANAQNISGKQDTIDSSHKLNSDLVNDTNQNNKFVTSAEKTKIANALTEETYNAGKTVAKGTTVDIDGITYTVGDYAEIFNGLSNKVAGNCSHAEGSYTMALGNYSHAEGIHSVASGNYSHAEGEYTTTSGVCSHAEGESTTASGNYSHAEGLGTTAGSNNQHVHGKYNIEDSSGKYTFIIGNGTDSDNCSNAFAIDWDGKIYVGNSSTGVDVSDLLARIIALENKVAALENA